MFSKQSVFSSFGFQRVAAERVSTVKHENALLAMNKHFDLSVIGLARLCWWELFVLNLIQNAFQHNTWLTLKYPTARTAEPQFCRCQVVLHRLNFESKPMTRGIKKYQIRTFQKDNFVWCFFFAKLVATQ